MFYRLSANVYTKFMHIIRISEYFDIVGMKYFHRNDEL